MHRPQNQFAMNLESTTSNTNNNGTKHLLQTENFSQETLLPNCNGTIGNLPLVKSIPNSTVPLNLSSSPPKSLPGAFTVPQERSNFEDADSSLSSIESYQTAVEELDLDYFDTTDHPQNSPPNPAL